MKKCPNCAEENLDKADFCYHCGYDLRSWSSPPTEQPTRPASGSGSDVDRTQPLHRRPAQQPPTYQPPNYPPSSSQTVPYPADPYPPTEPGGSYPPPQYQPPQQQYQQPASYQGTAYQPPYTPPPPPAYPVSSGQGVLRRDNGNWFWPVLVIGLGALLLFVCGMAVYTLTSATNNGVAQLGSQMSTQAAGVFAPAATQAAPDRSGQLDTPTPWPTFTAQPAAPGENPAEPGPTQPVLTDKLLTPACSSALDELGKTSNQATGQPFKLLDDAWRKEFNQSLADMKANCGSLDTASPLPGEISDVRRNLSQANTEYDQANQLWNDGITKRQPGKLLEAAQHLSQATKYLNQAISGLKNIVQ